MRDPVEGQRVARRVAQRACRLRKSRSTGVSTRAPLIVRYSVRLYTSITHETHAPVRVQMHMDEDCIYDPATHTYFGFSVSADGPHTRARGPYVRPTGWPLIGGSILQEVDLFFVRKANTPTGLA